MRIITVTLLPTFRTTTTSRGEGQQAGHGLHGLFPRNWICKQFCMEVDFCLLSPRYSPVGSSLSPQLPPPFRYSKPSPKRFPSVIFCCPAGAAEETLVRPQEAAAC